MIAVRNPRSGALDYSFASPTAAALAALTQRLRRHQPAWAALDMAARAALLQQFAAALQQHRSALQQALEIDTGRRRIASLEIDSVIAAIAAWSRLAPTLLDDDWTPGQSNPQLRYRPQWVAYPLVVVISPWNFPLLLAMIDAIPALLAGCAVIIKPSEVTPRFIAALQPAIAAVPGLADRLQLVPGDGSVGKALTPDARRAGIAVAAVAVVTFTSATVGQLAAIGLGALAGLILCRGSNPGATTSHVFRIPRAAGLVALAAYLTQVHGLGAGRRRTEGGGANRSC